MSMNAGRSDSFSRFLPINSSDVDLSFTPPEINIRMAQPRVAIAAIKKYPTI
jgi:hypothetical protein